MQISICNSIKDSRILAQSDAIEQINRFTLVNEMTNAIIEARQYPKGDDLYNMIKYRQTTWTPNATFIKTRSKENIAELSGLVFFDIDEFGNQQMAVVRERLMNNKHVLAVWLSFGGRGLGGVIRCDLKYKDHVWSALDQFEKQLNITIDNKVKHIAAQSVFTYDENVYINRDALPFTYDAEMAKEVAIKMAPQLKIAEQMPEGNWWEQMPSHTVNFKTRLEASEYGGNDYILIQDGRDFCEAYIPKGGLKKGSRNSYLISICHKIITNSPRASREEIERRIRSINTSYCKPPLSLAEVQKLFDWCWDNKVRGEVIVNLKIKYIWIDPDKELTTHQKRVIVGKGTGRLRRERTKLLIDNAVLDLMKKGYEITKQELTAYTGKSLRTIDRYWDGVMELVELNTNLPEVKTDIVEHEIQAAEHEPISTEPITDKKEYDIEITEHDVTFNETELRKVAEKIIDGDNTLKYINVKIVFDDEDSCIDELIQITLTDGSIKYIVSGDICMEYAIKDIKEERSKKAA